MRKEFDYLIIILLSIFYRMFFLFNNWNNTFLDSFVPYPLQPDAYYYYNILNFLPKALILILPIIFLSVGLIIFYKIIDMFNEKITILGTISLSLFYPFFIQTYISYVDTPSMIFAFLMAICYYVIKSIKSETKYIYYTIPLFICLKFLWSGWFILLIILVLTLGIINYNKINKYFVVGLFMACIAFVFANFSLLLEFFTLFNTISELRPNWNPIWLILNVLLFIMFLDIWKKKDNCIELRLPKDKAFVLILALIFSCMSMIMKRWTYLAMPFVVICIFLWLFNINKTTLKVFAFTIIFLSSLNALTTFTSLEPIMDNVTQIELQKLDNKLILCNWASGHIIDYFSNGRVLFKAHPSDFNYWIYALENNTDAFKNMTNESEYYIILNKWDQEKLNNSIDQYEIVSNNSKFLILER